VDRDLLALADQQYGLLTRTQLRAHGFDRNRTARWVRSGKLTPVQTNVLALAGSTAGSRRDLLAKVLETGSDATVSHTTAAWLWGIAGFTRDPVHIVVSRQSRHHHHLPWAVHQFTGILDAYQRTVHRIPTTSPALTMLHLAQVVGQQRLDRAIDNAWSLRLLTGEDLIRLDEDLAVQGRNGIVALREAARKRGPDWIPPQSNIESRFMSLLGPTGDEFERQVPITGSGWNARVDFLHRASRTVVEIQSERYHTSLTDRESDRRRRDRLEEAGYRVMEVWDDELFAAPELALDRILTAIRSAA
jgi:very-short-patch-repair endonuclease